MQEKDKAQQNEEEVLTEAAAEAEQTAEEEPKKKDKEWKVLEISDIDRKKLHGLFEE